MAKNKKRIGKSIESFDKLIEEHRKKIEEFGNDKEYLTSYWEKQIEGFEKEREKARKKLEK